MPRKTPPRGPVLRPSARRKPKSEVRLLKACMVALGAAAILMFSFVTVGMALEVGPAGLFRKISPDDPRTIVSAPIAVDLGGYSIKPGKRDHYVWVTVAMKVPGPHQEAEVCRLMPRLRAVVLQSLGDRLRGGSETPGVLPGVLAPALIDFARAEIGRVLDTDINREFGLLVLDDWRGAPPTSCPKDPGEEL
jgi:hypothetical protein